MLTRNRAICLNPVDWNVLRGALVLVGSSGRWTAAPVRRQNGHHRVPPRRSGSTALIPRPPESSKPPRSDDKPELV
ncbi:hypothetical protein DIE23_27100 [Burkholderia sp. Bp9143]|nr:hypothetical protein DIE23_27100 [Burkholderia sp. Bp9143]